MSEPEVPATSGATAERPARMPGSPRGGGQAGSRRGARLGRTEEVSAGGLVVDRSSAIPQAALIARRDRRGRLVWSLPKGHIEAGETAADAAIREVAEETGISGRIIAPLGVIDFWFIADGKRVHKTVHHFLLDAYGGTLSDEDVEVVEVRWFALGDVADALAYPDERRLLDQVPDLLAQAG